MEIEVKSAIVLDATGLVLGRMSGVVSKRLLQGERIMIVNAEKAIISGKRVSRVAEARLFLEAGHPGHGPYHPRRPDQIIRRTIRGMLPWRKPKGREAYKRLRVFMGVPDEIKDRPVETIPQANAKKLRCPYFTVGEFAKEIGWKPVGE
ncbi:MAG TPA: 50S ribosomal protein L13 [Candidatus Krumholzibacteriaceae bacterium]|jgi:large subunit ribosomal protein L13|nr:50S ribosomal protein L13 [Candidatus Krumholzibacteriaceae bacterium]